MLLKKYPLFGLMFLPGFTLATWVSRTPIMRDLLGASTEDMGFILFGFSCGSMLGILGSGGLINRLGIRVFMPLALAAMLSGLPVLALSLSLQLPVVAFFGLFLFGFGMGAGTVALNIQGAAYEAHLKSSIMPTLHGFFSMGTLAGALIGMFMVAFEINTGIHFITIFVIDAIIAIVMLSRMTWLETKKAEHTIETTSYFAQVRNELKDKTLLCLGVVILAMALAEGSANDWLPLLMIDGHGFNHSSGSLVYLAFTIGMTLGRFIGGRFVNQYGNVVMLKVSAVSAAISIALVVFADSQLLAASAVIFWGLGASLGFPLTISASGSTGNNSSVRVTIASTLGYLAFLVGPPSLGMIGQHAGLRNAMLPVLAMVVIAFFLSSAAREKKREQPGVNHSASN